MTARTASAQSLFERPMAAPTDEPAPASAPGANGTPAGSGAPAQPQSVPAAQAPAPAPAALPASAPERGQDDANAAARRAAAQLEGYSLIVVVPPKPKTFQKHDHIEIIINETSQQKFEQNLKADKKYNITAALKKFPSLQSFFEGQIRNGDSQAIAELDVGSNQKYEGDGEFERKDKFTARISAEVIDVKPNGDLVLEARKLVDSNGETTTMVLSGICRGEDVTRSNTIQSSQLADMILKVQNEGDVKDAARKGWIPKILEAVFNF